ncbi:hypothetical protein N9D08_00785 [bacterium]|nr:hypothetical protein [bacterium]
MWTSRGVARGDAPEFDAMESCVPPPPRPNCDCGARDATRRDATRARATRGTRVEADVARRRDLDGARRAGRRRAARRRRRGAMRASED